MDSVAASLDARARAAARRVRTGRRPPGVYTQGDFGPLVTRFEQTEMVADSGGRLRRQRADDDDYPENDAYAVDNHVRSHMRNFGAEAPLTEADRPRDNRTASNMVIRRTTGVGHEAPDHSEMNLSIMGRDPRGTADGPDHSQMRRWSERRRAYIEKTLKGQDSAAQDPGDERPSDRSERDRRVLATDILRDRLKIFTTAYGNMTYRGAPKKVARPGEGQHEARIDHDRHGVSAGDMADAMTRPTNPATSFAAAQPGWGGVPDHQFAVSSYQHITSGAPPSAHANLAASTVQDQELALAQQAQNYRAAAMMRGAFESARQVRTDEETFAVAREAAQRAAAVHGPHETDARRADFDGDWASSKSAATVGNRPRLSRGGRAENLVDEAAVAEQTSAKLEATAAFAKLARTAAARDPKRARVLAHRLEKAEGHFEPGRETRARNARAAPMASASAAASRPWNARHQQDFADAKRVANYSAAPASMANSGIGDARRHRSEALAEQRVTRNASAKALATSDPDAAIVEDGTFSNNEGGRSRASSLRRKNARGTDALASARSALVEGGGLGVSGGEGMTA